MPANSVTVVGMGKIGLPLAVQFALKGFQVIGTDINPRVIENLTQGKAPFPGEKDLNNHLKRVIESGLFRADLDTTKAVSVSRVVVVVVPLYVNANGEPDFRSIDNATRAIGKGLTKGSLVAYETTLPIGTTRNRFTPMLEEISGMKVDESFHVVFSPERVLSGRVFEDLKRYPKLVGGVSEKSEAAGVDFYRRGLDFDSRPDLPQEIGVWPMGTCEAAEFAKLAETTYRDVNIALANQFAIFADSYGIDLDTVIQASNSQPFSHIHKPGIAVGGHCIPIYPQMYLWNDPAASLVRTARQVNESMPAKSVQLLQEIHGSLQNQTVVVLGISYRGGVKESAFSGVFPLVESLLNLGAKVFVQDPMYSDEEIKLLGFEPFVPDTNVDIVVVQSDHREYSELKESDFPGVKTAFDGRGILKIVNWKSVKIFVIGKRPYSQSFDFGR